MTEKQLPGDGEIEAMNPRYKGATPEMLALALLRSRKDDKREDKEDLPDSDPA